MSIALLSTQGIKTGQEFNSNQKPDIQIVTNRKDLLIIIGSFISIPSLYMLYILYCKCYYNHSKFILKPDAEKSQIPFLSDSYSIQSKKDSGLTIYKDGKSMYNGLGGDSGEIIINDVKITYNDWWSDGRFEINCWQEKPKPLKNHDSLPLTSEWSTLPTTYHKNWEYRYVTIDHIPDNNRGYTQNPRAKLELRNNKDNENILTFAGNSKKHCLEKGLYLQNVECRQRICTLTIVEDPAELNNARPLINFAS